MTLPSPAPLHRALLGWFDREQRDLPWRRTRDAYAIWVSEVMLQQTQVDRVIGYWERFLERFPTVEALAQAPAADVLAAWRGLGYYSRARNLHRAARVLVEAHGGVLPRELEGLRQLPGFGRYTAGAVASIAFGAVTPLVDGNVARVLARLLEIDGSPPDREREATLWAAATHLVHPRRPGDWNQALMELGATVCLPRSPLCLLCPLRGHCRALAADRVEALPPPRKAAPRKRLEFAVAVARRGARVLLARREETGLFGGLWEMPMAPCAADQAPAPLLRALVGARATIGPELSVIERTLTHRDLVLRLFPVEAPGRLGPPPHGYLEWRWVEAAELPTLGMSSAMALALAEAAPPRPAKVKRAARGTGAAPRGPAR